MIWQYFLLNIGKCDVEYWDDQVGLLNFNIGVLGIDVDRVKLLWYWFVGLGKLYLMFLMLGVGLKKEQVYIGENGLGWLSQCC